MTLAFFILRWKRKGAESIALKVRCTLVSGLASNLFYSMYHLQHQIKLYVYYMSFVLFSQNRV